MFGVRAASVITDHTSFIVFTLFFYFTDGKLILSNVLCLQQQLQVQHLSQLQGLALPVAPLPLGLTPPTLPAVSSSSGLLSLSSILANYSHGQPPVAKEDKARDVAERAPRGDDGDKSD